MSDQASKIQMQLNSLREKHEITVMELTDLKEDNEKLKKLNTTLVENFNKGPENCLREIRLIIDGSFYNQRILDLEAQIERLNNSMEQKVQARLQSIKSNVQTDHLECREDMDKIKRLMEEKNEQFDKIRLQNDELKVEIDILKRQKKSGVPQEKYRQLEQINKILEENLRQHESNGSSEDLHAYYQEQLENLNQQWSDRYENLNSQFEKALKELENFKRLEFDKGKGDNLITRLHYYENNDQTPVRQLFRPSNDKENMMKRQIQNLVGQLNTKKSTMPRQSTAFMGSRISTAFDSDCSGFSIKDAINRPNQLSFF